MCNGIPFTDGKNSAASWIQILDRYMSKPALDPLSCRGSLLSQVQVLSIIIKLHVHVSQQLSMLQF